MKQIFLLLVVAVLLVPVAIFGQMTFDSVAERSESGSMTINFASNDSSLVQATKVQKVQLVKLQKLKDTGAKFWIEPGYSSAPFKGMSHNASDKRNMRLANGRARAIEFVLAGAQLMPPKQMGRIVIVYWGKNPYGSNAEIENLKKHFQDSLTAWKKRMRFQVVTNDTSWICIFIRQEVKKQITANKELKKRLSDLEAKNEELEDRLRSLEAENDTLKKQLAEVTAEQKFKNSKKREKKKEKGKKGSYFAGVGYGIGGSQLLLEARSSFGFSAKLMVTNLKKSSIIMTGGWGPTWNRINPSLEVGLKLDFYERAIDPVILSALKYRAYKGLWIGGFFGFEGVKKYTPTDVDYLMTQTGPRSWDWEFLKIPGFSHNCLKKMCGITATWNF